MKGPIPNSPPHSSVLVFTLQLDKIFILKHMQSSPTPPNAKINALTCPHQPILHYVANI